MKKQKKRKTKKHYKMSSQRSPSGLLQLEKIELDKIEADALLPFDLSTPIKELMTAHSILNTHSQTEPAEASPPSSFSTPEIISALSKDFLNASPRSRCHSSETTLSLSSSSSSFSRPSSSIDSYSLQQPQDQATEEKPSSQQQNSRASPRLGR
jgi:hypothetical protein